MKAQKASLLFVFSFTKRKGHLVFSYVKILRGGFMIKFYFKYKINNVLNI
jgi:hypothetical protein